MTIRTRIVCATALCFGIGASAAETHGKHVHGHAVLRLAQEGAEVVAHFESPLESIVGFEHAPTNEEQRAAFKAAMRLVAVPENILRLPEVCTSTGEPVVDVPYVADGQGDDEHAHESSGDAAHDDHDHHDDHDTVDNDGDGHQEEEVDGAHADLEATFNFRCESSPEWLEVTALATFDGLEEVELQAVVADAAVAETLTAASPRAALTGF